MQETHEKLKKYFDEQGVKFECFSHQPCDSSYSYQQTLGTRMEEQAKALLLRYTDQAGVKGYAVITIASQKRINLMFFKKLLQAKEIRLADLNQLQAVTGCLFGELPPVAKLFGFQLYMDKDLLQEKLIYFNAAIHDHSIKVDPKEIQRIEAPTLF